MEIHAAAKSAVATMPKTDVTKCIVHQAVSALQPCSKALAELGKHKKMSKVGSSALRRTLFLVMSIYLQRSPMDQPVFQFMNRKRAEGKPYKVYMMASANKFLRIYYATVKAYLNSLDKT